MNEIYFDPNIVNDKIVQRYMTMIFNIVNNMSTEEKNSKENTRGHIIYRQLHKEMATYIKEVFVNE